MTSPVLTEATTESTEFSASPVPELGPHTPFAYGFARPVFDPVEPVLIPRLGTHHTTTTYTSCDSAEWCGSFYG